MIARDGYPVVGLSWGLAAVSMVGVMVLPFPALARWVVIPALFVLFGVFPLYFFRDPPRITPPGAQRLLLSPADGRIVAIASDVEAPHYLQGPVQRISIFLSVFNVHVNRIPADGVVEYDRYVPGTHYLAWLERASRENEQSQLGVRHPSGHRIAFSQVTGGFLRRIIYHVRRGDRVCAGDRFGIIRFGSRCDVFVPASITLAVSVGDQVRAGETVLASLGEG